MKKILVFLLSLSLSCQAQTFFNSPQIAVKHSTALESNHVIKASAGNLYSLTVNAAGAGWVMLCNNTSAPVDGALPSTCFSYQVPGGQTTSFLFGTGAAAYFSTGVVVIFSTTGPLTKTASATAYFTWQVQ